MDANNKTDEERYDRKQGLHYWARIGNAYMLDTGLALRLLRRIWIGYSGYGSGGV